MELLEGRVLALASRCAGRQGRGFPVALLEPKIREAIWFQGGAMSKLESASARLAAALARLEEEALPLAEARAQSQSHKARIADLVVERDKLLARLAELEDESRSLVSVNEEIETRLDSAIGEIRAALGR
jgi:chromosome segregation ATPase